MCEWRDVQGCTGAARSHRSQEAPYLTFPRKRGEGISFFVERAAALPIPSPARGGGLGRGPLGSVSVRSLGKRFGQWPLGSCANLNEREHAAHDHASDNARAVRRRRSRVADHATRCGRGWRRSECYRTR